MIAWRVFCLFSLLISLAGNGADSTSLAATSPAPGQRWQPDQDRVGARTGRIAPALKAYDPDRHWSVSSD